MEKLSSVKEGKYKIVDITKIGKLKKMCDLGILIGDIIEVIKPAPGPIIIKKGNITVAVGYGMAMDVIVEKIE
ncbi:MAG: ferrous iron transport protein A [bacterium]|nr:ferrous iron transport protein A [bacterium]MCX7917774.1 ferrous iron transport protein A [bacterium]MDW8164659.1 FeoA family protein [Candidatus Omnitrophota bacterium]